MLHVEFYSVPIWHVTQLLCSPVILLKALLHYAFFSCFSSRFGYQHVGIQNVSENVRKMREK